MHEIKLNTAVSNPYTITKWFRDFFSSKNVYTNSKIFHIFNTTYRGGGNISSNNINPKEFLNEGSSQSMERDGLIWLI